MDKTDTIKKDVKPGNNYGLTTVVTKELQWRNNGENTGITPE